MRRKTSSFLIGVFVIMGILLGIFALGWLGEAQRLVRSYTTYAAYFPQSVRGLYRSSTVAFQGIDIGHVQAIDVAPDPTYVMVTMRIYRPGLVSPRTYAQIDTTGLAGVAYVNLSDAPSGQPSDPPRYDFPVPYPVIPTRPSQLDAILAATQSIVGQIRGSDLPALIHEADLTVQAAGNVLGGAQTQQILASLQAASQGLNSTLTALNTVLNQGQLQQMLAETSRSVAEAGKLLSALQAQTEAAQLPQAAATTRQTIEDLDAQIRVLSTQTNAALENLNRASDSLNRLLQLLYQRPSDLLQSQPAPERGGTR
jgi:phospholipid/cholesterol/gamma-HCH transport system substrate-binding protein